MASVVRSTSAFHLIAEVLIMCLSLEVFVRLTILRLQGFEVIYPIFELSITLRTRLPDAFRHLVPDNNFHCQTPVKNAKFDLFGSENLSWQIWLRIEIG